MQLYSLYLYIKSFRKRRNRYMKDVVLDGKIKNLIISKEDFVKYFNKKQILSRKKYQEYFNKNIYKQTF